MGLTVQLAKRIAGARPQDFIDPALSIAQLGFMDTIATAFAGVAENATVTAQVFARRRIIEASESCDLPWLTAPMPVPMAALVTGTAGHALDFDDVSLSGHPSTVIVPALLCEAVARHLPGRVCLEAYVVGFEIWAELFRREPSSLHAKGWHPTAFYGILAATAALAYTRRMTAADTATALAVAASFASGVVSNFGTMTKPLHAGRAAALAFEALEYTDLGLTASHDALEHASGFLNALSPSGQALRDLPLRNSDDWAIIEHGLCIKQYPVCYGAHRAIDGMIDLAVANNLKLGDVKEVSVGLGPAQLAMLRNTRPQTGLEAKFSIQFAMAAALDQRNVGLAQLTDEYVGLPHIQEFFEHVTSWRVDVPDPADPTFSRHDIVQVTLTDGRRLSSGEIQYPRGHAAKPLETVALRAKFEDCLKRFQPPAGTGAAVLDVESFFRRVTSMANCADMSRLFDA
jgi:2-methylcitrate dehydratase PrpD